jgi:Bacterial PH domain
MTVNEIDKQLAEIGLKFKWFGRPEITELSKLLLPSEKILHCLNGFYEGGFALLCATSNRLLLVDKRLMFLNLEDVRYETITEVNLAVRLIDSTIVVHVGGRKLSFRGYSERRMRSLCRYVQGMITALRSQEQTPQIRQAMAALQQTGMVNFSNQVRPLIRRPKKFYGAIPVDEALFGASRVE